MLEEYRVTQVFEKESIDAKITISLRLMANNHQEASALAFEKIEKDVFGGPERRPPCTHIFVQNPEQIDRGEVERL